MKRKLLVVIALFSLIPVVLLVARPIRVVKVSGFSCVECSKPRKRTILIQNTHTPIRPQMANSSPIPQAPTCNEMGSTYWHEYISILPGATEDEKRTLTAIMECESGGNNCKMNYQGSGACGLFQFIPTWHPAMRNGACLDGYKSTAYALEKIRAGGISLWNASRHCWEPKLNF